MDQTTTTQSRQTFRWVSARNRQAGKTTVVVCVILGLIFLGVLIGRTLIAENQKRKEDQLLAQERKRVEAQREAERETVERELIARNLSASTASEALWSDFRGTYPYHSQVLALSAPSSDGSRTLLIPEPPPHLTLGKILFSVGHLLRNHDIKTHRIGHDGWVKDIVIALNGSDQEVASLLSSLHRLLFYTSYKGYVVPLPTRKSVKATYSLDLKVTAGDLKRWIIDERETFVSVEGGPSISLDNLFAQTNSGVYFSTNPGLVAWWIPKDQTMPGCQVQVRQFVLDSDLVIGALSDGEASGIIVLGRERVVPVDELPPLRFETLSLLASVQKGQEGQLEQSYERNHPLAGRIEGKKDWAPILLSPELVDTEYGSLLNITDQLLKGWSNNGDTHYYNFDYPIPGRWPFKASLMSLLQTNHLTYNWNTKGTGYTVNVNDHKLFSLNRTGALPVSYIPEGAESETSQEVVSAEDAAYDYFSSLSDPNLVRVVQYAAMYQIFSAFNIAKGPEPLATNPFPTSHLKDLTKSIIDEVHHASPQGLTNLAQQLAPLVAIQAGGFDFGRQELIERIEDSLKKADYEPKDSKIPYLRQLYVERSEDRLIRFLSLSALAALKKLPDQYAEAIAARAKEWIHTPVVVISWSSGVPPGRILIGGHNLGAKVTKFKVSEEVPIGRTKVDPEGNILINPHDAEKVGDVVRIAGRNAKELPESLSAKMGKAIAKINGAAPRTRAEALALTSTSRETLAVRHFPGSSISGTRQANWGLLPSESPLKQSAVARLRTARETTPGVVVVERQGDGAFLILHSEESSPIRAFTPEDATDAVVQLLNKNPKQSNSLRLELRGFKQHDGTSFVRSCQVRAEDRRIPKEISALIKDEGIPEEALREARSRKYDFSNASVKDPEIELLATGELRSKIVVEVPAKGANTSPGRAAIELEFGKGTPREIVNIVIERILKAIRDVLREMRSQFDAVIFNYRINAEIKRISIETGVDIKLIRHQFNDGSKDLYFAGREVDANEAPDPTSCDAE